MRISAIILLLIIAAAHPLYAAWWDKNAIPLPSGTEEVFQETRSISGSDFVFKHYDSSQDAESISSFFRSRLTALDWKEKELLREAKEIPNLKIPGPAERMLATMSVFEKEGEMVMISFIPKGTFRDKKTRFSIARGKMETKEHPGEDDFIPRLAGKPKLDIAPVYPGAALIALSEYTSFMRATYFAKDDIKKVAEFYKDKMVDYGWSLKEEKPLQKLGSGEEGHKPVSITMQEFDFSNPDGDICIIALTNSGPKQAVGSKLENTTIIMVQYEKSEK